jgi:hypothetical protein
MSPTVMVGSGVKDAKVPPGIISACEHIARINGDGSIVWTVPVRGSAQKPDRTYDSVSRGVSVADLDGDDVPDLAYLTSRGLFRVLDYRDGHVIYEFDAAKLLGEGKSASDGSHSPVLADFNGDGKLDAFFVVGGGGELNDDKTHKPRYGVAVCLTGFDGKASPTNGWYMFRHDAQNTGAGALDPELVKHIPLGGR